MLNRMRIEDSLGEVAPGNRTRLLAAPSFGGFTALAASFTRHSYAPHAHAEYAFGVVTAGIERFRRRKTRFLAGPGDIVIIPPETAHDAWTGPEGYAYRMLYPSASVVTAAAAAGGAATEAPWFPDSVIKDSYVAHALLAAVAAVESADRLTADETMARAAALLVRRHATGRPHSIVSEGRDSGAIARARARLDDDPAAAPGLEALAAEAGLPPWRLTRGFQRETGLSPSAYLRARRVGVARTLLRDGATGAETAAACGFADQAHLTRVFKAIVGVTPGAFARAWAAR